MRVGGYVIHLARAVERRVIVEHLTGTLPFPCEVLDAVDGRGLTEAEVEERVSPRPLFDPPYPFPLGRGEIACFLSHRLAWARIVESGHDFGFIAEDDLGLSPSFMDALGFVLRHASVSDFVSFQTRPFSGRFEVVVSEGRHRLLRPVVPPLRLTAQLVGRVAAQKLLKASLSFDRPVDALVQAFWHTGQHVLVLDPMAVRDCADVLTGSTIQARNKSIMDELRRTLKRTIYRADIVRMANQLR